MKKLFAIIMAMLAIGIAGCAGTVKSVDPHEAADAIIKNVTFRDTLVEAQGDVAKEWYTFDDKVKDYAVFISGSGATAEEVAVIRSDDAKAAGATIEKRVADLKARFENYVPTEMAKLSNPVIVTKGDTVILVIADDAEQARKTVEDLYK